MIAEVITFMSETTSIKNDYFAIHITPGVYREYEVEDENKKNLIMNETVMDSTVITSKQSFIDYCYI